MVSAEQQAAISFLFYVRHRVLLPKVPSPTSGEEIWLAKSSTAGNDAWKQREASLMCRAWLEFAGRLSYGEFDPENTRETGSKKQLLSESELAHTAKKVTPRAAGQLIPRTISAAF